ncbi:MAG: hypothetical protein H6Q63_1179 [Firmicutes bacterium]|nr:hypothetical protein [Bacillota bacterium]
MCAFHASWGTVLDLDFSGSVGSFRCRVSEVAFNGSSAAYGKASQMYHTASRGLERR